MTPKGEGSPSLDEVEVVGHNVPSEPQKGAWVAVRWSRAPDWMTTLDFDADGRLVGLAVAPYAPWAPAPLPEVAPVVPSTPLTASFLRRLPTGLFERAARRHLRGVTERMAGHIAVMAESFPNVGMPDVEALHRWSATFSKNPRPGRAGRTNRDYAAVAALYVEKLGSGTEAKDLAAELYLTESAVRSILHKARERGLLTPAPPGVAGGELTDKARQALADTDQEA